jgi:HAMP domain-containing protein
MSLRTRFNLALLALFVVTGVVAALVTRKLVYEDARRNLVRSAGVMMDSASAIQGYTFEQVRPRLAPLLSGVFPPQIVPAYAASQTMLALRDRLPGFVYKEATINATNPADEAVGWEVGLVQDLRRLAPDAQVVVERYDEQGQAQLVVARQIRIEQPDCLACHSEPSAAPASMIKIYGPARGFGWTMNQVIGAQIVGVPLQIAEQSAFSALRSLALVLGALCLVLLAALNLMLGRIVINPLNRLARLANEASLGKEADFSRYTDRRDEIGSLANAFTRTLSGLRRAIGMIDRDPPPPAPTRSPRPLR